MDFGVHPVVVGWFEPHLYSWHVELLESHVDQKPLYSNAEPRFSVPIVKETQQGTGIHGGPTKGQRRPSSDLESQSGLGASVPAWHLTWPHGRPASCRRWPQQAEKYSFVR